MTDLRAGSTQITDVKSGSTNINEVYVGSSQVWTRTLVDPETGWNSTSSSGTNNSGSHYSNSVEIKRNCTLKFSISALSGDDTFNSTSNVSTYIEINSGSGFPISGASSYYWGNGGINDSTVSYSNVYTISLNAGDFVRINYFLGQSGKSINNRITVRDNSDQSIVDQNIDSDHTWASSGGGTCFLADSLVTMQDLSKKRIADMQVGDIVLGDGGVANEVIELRETAESDQTLFAINHLRTTESHPIKTESGWKAINPEAAMILHPEMTITQIAVGDRLARVNDSGESYFEDVATITSETLTAPVYNLNVSGSDTPDIDGNDTYIVDGVMVHNK